METETKKLKLHDLMEAASKMRQNILNLETGGLLHDLGKMRKDFLTAEKNNYTLIFCDEMKDKIMDFFLDDDTQKRDSNNAKTINRFIANSIIGNIKDHNHNDLYDQDFFNLLNKYSMEFGIDNESNSPVSLLTLLTFGRLFGYLSVDILNKHIPENAAVLCEILGLCHGIAHFEKPDAHSNMSQFSEDGPAFLSSPFGNYYSRLVKKSANDMLKDINTGNHNTDDSHPDSGIPEEEASEKQYSAISDDDIDTLRKKLLQHADEYLNVINRDLNQNIKPADKKTNTEEDLVNLAMQRDAFLQSARALMGKTVADSRITVNDVTLWSWGYLVATLLKPLAAYSYMLHGIRPADGSDWLSNKYFLDLWPGYTVLSLNIDRFRLIEKAVKLADITWFDKALDSVFRQIKELLEVECPVANEIYRDEHGIYFILPGNIEIDEAAETRIRETFFPLKALISDTGPKSRKDHLLSSMFDLNLAPITGTAKKEIYENPDFNHAHADRFIRDENNMDSETIGDKYPKEFSDIRTDFKNVLEKALSNFFIGTLKLRTMAARKPRIKLQPDAAAPEKNKRLTCPVCQLRSRTFNQDICDICNSNRQTAKTIITEEKSSRDIVMKSTGGGSHYDRHHSVWSSEIADSDRKTAMLSLKIDPSYLLSAEAGNSFTVEPKKQDGDIYKNISPVRISRMREVIGDYLLSTVNKYQDALYQESETGSLRFHRLFIHTQDIDSNEDDRLYADKYQETEKDNKLYLENKINGNRIMIEKKYKGFVTVENLERLFPGSKSGPVEQLIAKLNNQVSGRHNGEKQDWIITGNSSNSKLPKRILRFSFEKYLPFRKIYSDQLNFVFMLPAADVPYFMELAYQMYRQEFAQVQNRMPLQSAAVFMSDKMSVGAAFEALHFWRTGELQSELCPLEDINTTTGKYPLKTGCSLVNEMVTNKILSGCELTLSTGYGREKVCLAGNFAYWKSEKKQKAGDEKIKPDHYYGRWLTRHENLNWIDMINLREIFNEQQQKSTEDNNQGEAEPLMVGFTPSTFTYLNLDSTSARFNDFSPQTMLISVFLKIYRNYAGNKHESGLEAKIMHVFQLLEGKKAGFGLTQKERTASFSDPVFLRLAGKAVKKEGLSEYITSGKGKSFSGEDYQQLKVINNLFIKTLKGKPTFF